MIFNRYIFPLFIAMFLFTVAIPTISAQSWCYRYADRDGRAVGEQCFSTQSTCDFARQTEQRGSPTTCSGGGSVVPQASPAGPQAFVPLTENLIGTGQQTDVSGFLNTAFKIGVGVAAMLTVIMITVGGFEYMSSDAPWQKSDGKTRIWGAIIGLAIILLSAVILGIINPDILSFRFFS